MIKKLIVLASIFLSITSWAQDNTASPYTYYGLGEANFNGSIEARSTGGLSIVADSSQINLLNPAHFSKINYTTFTVGSSMKYSKFENSFDIQKSQRNSFDYLAILIPTKKINFSIGLMPSYSVGYKMEKNFTNSSDETLRNKKIFGNGILNKVFVSGAYKINNKISAGIELSYNFGKITDESVEFIVDPEIQLGSRERNTFYSSGISSKFGISYSENISSKVNMLTSLTFKPQSTINLSASRNFATIIYSTSGAELIDEQIKIDLPNKKIKNPTKISYGMGFEEKNKWLIGTEISYIENSKLENRLDNINNSHFKNAFSLGLGGYYIPKYNSFTNYLNRIIYRVGFRYEKTGLVINSNEINDYGMTFGLGLPVGLSKINLGFEFGKKGTTNQNLIQENYFNFNVGLSLNDLWFRKRKID